MSIRLRLTMWYTGILAGTLLLFGAGLYFFLHYYLYDQIRSEMQVQGNKTYQRILPVYSLRGSGLDLLLDDTDVLSSSYYTQVYNFTDNTVSRSWLLQQTRTTLPVTQETKKLLQEKESFFEKITLWDEPFLVYNKPLFLPTSGGGYQIVGVLQMGTRIGTFEQFFQLLQYILFMLAFVAIFAAATVGLFLARKALMPIDKVIAAANQIQQGADLGRRIDYNGPYDEVGRLTHTINGMLDRIHAMYTELDEAYRAQRRFVSDASHELRTPLTTIRGNVDLLERMWTRAAEASGEGNDGHDPEQLQLSLEAMKDIAGEAQRMSRLVGDLLSLARADAGVQMEKAEVELKPVVEEVARRAAFLDRKAEWIVGSLEALDGVRVTGSRDYLQQLLFIFIENAFKYTPEGTVTMDAVRADGQIGIRIADTGIGMEKEEVPHIFERFYRADESRGRTSGTGLGLSIAKWIIDEHGGSIEVMTRKDTGTTFVIWLPARFQAALQ
ncbi:sensor histidine kinase [Paenibacillus chartarius]|uniref:histidine kinase n=1 Tax=Paenibacillus chartarius TaxID=747481 RepID=A0ABV6DK38_9BACL